MRSIGALTLAAALAQAAPAAPTFVDVAAQTGLVSTFDSITGYPGLHGHMVGGGAVADFNADGRPDVFLPAGGTAPDRLFINQGPGTSGQVTFAEQAGAWGCDATHRSGGVATADVNRDGYPDLFVVSMGDASAGAVPSANLLYINNGPDETGAFSFTERGASSGVTGIVPIVDGLGAAFGDYDLDGDLDLAVAHWSSFFGNFRLLANDGTGHFTDTTDLLEQPGSNIRGFQPRFADLNGDRYPELVVTGDFGTSVIWFNLGPDDADGVSFELRQKEANLGADCNAMGSALADFNNDLLLDWYITNIYYDISDTCGNTLYLCQGLDEHNTPVFEDLARERGAQQGGWGWGTCPIDLDHDGDLDIAATGGWRFWDPIPSRLYINDGTAHFSDAAAAAGTDFVGFGRGYVPLDYDNDGDLDLLLIANENTARLYENRTPEAAANHWLRVDVTTTTNPCLAPGGFGTHLYLTAGGVTQTHHLDGAPSYLACGQQTAHFGLGAADTIDALEIRWADGSATTLTDVAPDQILHVTAYHPADFNADGSLDGADIAPYADAFLSGDPAADLDRDGALNVDDIEAFVAALAGDACP
ncbi:MAG: hypothetical protein DHS20C14_07710 [Phycisphaeraceae bacterium]|nr:MAG: hypothetical protein DHS20C14_07710 [Phycisphaeraceae bacterium]